MCISRRDPLDPVSPSCSALGSHFVAPMDRGELDWREPGGKILTDRLIVSISSRLVLIWSAALSAGFGSHPILQGRAYTCVPGRPGLVNAVAGSLLSSTSPRPSSWDL